MLSKLLSHETCAECRICCGFVDSDKWEIPIFAGEEESLSRGNGAGPPDSRD